jgi:hypothetical protein
MIYDPRGLPGVNTVGLGVDGVLQMVSKPTSRFHGRVWVRGLSIWRMTYVGPECSHGMAYNDTRHIDIAKRRGSWLGVGR